MNAETPETAVDQPAKPEAQAVEPKPVTTLKTDKPAKTSKTPKAKGAKPATVKGKQAKKPTKATAKANKAKAPVKQAKPAKPSKSTKAKKSTKVSKKAKTAKAVPQGKFPRHKANPFRAGSAYGAIFDAFVRREAGIRRDALTALAVEATGKPEKNASYDLAVILSAKESNTGPRHPSCRPGFWIRRENDHLTLMVD